MKPNRSPSWQVAVALVVATIGAAALGYLAVQLFYLPETLARSQTGQVPDLTGMEIDEARARAESRDYAVRQAGLRVSMEVEEGHVIYQTPPPDFHLPMGDTIRVLVSRGEPTMTVPEVAGLQPELAQSIFRQLGLEMTPPRRASSDIHLQGTIIETVPPAGTSVGPGTAITLVLSGGGSIQAMPDVRGLTLAAARDTLDLYSLTVGEVTGMEPGTLSGDRAVVVASQEPAAGRNVRSGAAVRLQLGQAPAP